MKKLLLASVVIFGLNGVAHAAIPVEDIAAEIGISKETLETVRNGLTQLHQLQTELQSLQQHVYMAENIIHDPTLGTFVALSGQLGLNNNLPLNPSMVVGLVSGLGGPANFNSLIGKLSMLNGLTNSSFNNNHLYTCGENSFACQQAQANAASIAGVQGIGGTIYADLTAHMTKLTNLQTTLLGAKDPKTVQDATAEINNESAWLQNQQAQIQVVSLLQEAQVRSNEQMATERFHQDTANTIASIPN